MSNDNIPQPKLKPLTREDLPPTPPLRNYARGIFHPLLALGFLTPWDLLAEHAAELKIKGCTPMARARVFWEQIRDRLPLECSSHIWAADHHLSPCFVITSNKTPERLRKAEDLELINRTREALGIDLGPPQWYSPG